MRKKAHSINGLSKFRTALLKERERLLADRIGDPEALKAPSGVAVEDQAPVLHDQFVLLRQRRLLQSKLRLIEAALQRWQQGEYGCCEECGEDIPLKRLEVVPWAAFCVACQQRFDRTQKEDPAAELILTA
jgi:DnaK suppressor protein